MEEVFLHNQNQDSHLINQKENVFNVDEIDAIDLNANLTEKNILNSDKADNLDNVNNIKKNNKKNKLFLKILIFQVIVSGFVFLTLFTLKKTFPLKFKVIATQLQAAINSGPKFYDSVNSAFNKVKNFSLVDKLKSLSKQNNLNDEIKKVSDDKKASDNTSDNNSNFNANKINSSSDSTEKKVDGACLQNQDCFLSNEQVVEDNLENMSLDDGDVLFANFVVPIANRGVRISSKFGQRVNPITKELGEFHKGVDVVAGIGTQIRSIAKGEVIGAGFSKKSGNWIKVKHNNGYESVFAHCKVLLKKVGDKVEQGEVIALVGKSGDVTGAHMHFGCRKDGNWIDPKVLFPAYG